MQYCGFCGKGPFPESSALKKQIRRRANCNEAARQQWDNYATNMWDNAPEPSNNDLDPAAVPPNLEEETTLEDDLQEVEKDMANGGDTGDAPGADEMPHGNPEGNGMPPVVHGPIKVTDEDAEIADEESTTYYIEEFPGNLGGGAVWEEDVPFFEKIWLDQQENGTSRWGPFDNQDEWELAQWLVRNVGQKQINALLNMNIVSFNHFLSFSPDLPLILSIYDRRVNEQSPPIITVARFSRKSMLCQRKGQIGFVMS